LLGLERGAREFISLTVLILVIQLENNRPYNCGFLGVNPQLVQKKYVNYFNCPLQKDVRVTGKPSKLKSVSKTT
jgi:hypothetical protein